jgi:hypothetical protein
MFAMVYVILYMSCYCFALQAPHATTPAAAAAAMQHITSLAGADSGTAVGSLLARALLLHEGPGRGPRRQDGAAATQQETAQQLEQQKGTEQTARASSEQVQQQQQEEAMEVEEAPQQSTSPLPDACEGKEVLLAPLTDRNTRKVGPWGWPSCTLLLTGGCVASNPLSFSTVMRSAVGKQHVTTTCKRKDPAAHPAPSQH